MAPSLIASYEVDSTASNNTSLVTPSFTPSNGEVIVVKVVNEDGAQVVGTPTGGSQTYTSRASLTGTGHCAGSIYTAVVAGSPGSMTVTVPFTGTANWHSMVVERWSGAQLAATPATNATKNGTGTGSSATLTTVANGSIVTSLDGDFSARAPGVPAYRSSATQDGLHDKSTANYVAYYFYQTATTAGSQTIGLTTPASGTQAWTMLGIEVQAGGVSGTAAGTATATGSAQVALVATGLAVATGSASTSLSGTASGTATAVGSSGVSLRGAGTATAVGLTDPLVLASDSCVTVGTATVAAVSTGSASAQGSAGVAAVALGTSAATGQAEGTPSGTTYRVWPATSGPGSNAGDTSTYTMGMRFLLSVDANLTAIYWWRATSTSTPPTQCGVFNDDTGVLVATAETFADPGAATGWIKQVLVAPVALVASQAYKVAVYGTSLGYSATANYWDTGAGAAGITTGIITAPNNASSGGQDTFSTSGTPMQHPTSSFNAGNYWIDLEVTASGGGISGQADGVATALGLAGVALRGDGTSVAIGAAGISSRSDGIATATGSTGATVRADGTVSAVGTSGASLRSDGSATATGSTVSAARADGSAVATGNAASGLTGVAAGMATATGLAALSLKAAGASLAAGLAQGGAVASGSASAVGSAQLSAVALGSSLVLGSTIVATIARGTALATGSAVVIPTGPIALPLDRTLIVAAESRTLDEPIESRTFTPLAESRVLEVA